MDSSFKFTVKTKFGVANATNAFVQGIENLNYSNFSSATVYGVANTMVYTGDKVIDAEKAANTALSAGNRFYVGTARNNQGKKVSGLYTVNPDTNLCWAATAANLLVRSSWAASIIKSSGAKTTDYLLNTFRHGFKANTEAGDGEIGISGGSIENAIKWFFTGKVTNDFHVDYREGGYLPNTKYAVTYQDINKTNGRQLVKNMDQKLKNGEAVGASIFVVEGNQLSGGHAVTVCGFVYDNTKKNKPGYYAGIILTDSDDSIITDPTAATNLMKVQQLEWDGRIGAYRIKDYAGGNYIVAGFTSLAANRGNVSGKAENNSLYYHAPNDANWWLPQQNTSKLAVTGSVTATEPDSLTLPSANGPVEEIAAGERYVAQAGEVWSETAIFGELRLSGNATLDDGYIGVGGVVKANGGSWFDGTLRVAGQLLVNGTLKADNSLSDLYDTVVELDFLVMMQEAGTETALVKNLDRIRGDYQLTATVAVGQEEGRYTLADGARQFDDTISVYSSVADSEKYQEDQLIGYLSAASTLIVDGKEYRLNLTNKGVLQFTVGSSTETGTVYRDLVLNAVKADFAGGSRAEFLTVAEDASLTVAAGAAISDTKVEDWGSLVLNGKSDGILNIESFADVTINADAEISGTITVAGMLEVTGAVNADGAEIYLNLSRGFGDLDAYIENIDLLNGAAFHIMTSERPANGTFLIGRGDAISETFAVEVNWGGKLTINSTPVTVGSKSYALYGDGEDLVIVIANATNRAPGAAQVSLNRVDPEFYVAAIRYNAGSSRNEYALNDGAFELYYDTVAMAVTDYLGTRSSNEYGGVETWRQNANLRARGSFRQTGGEPVTALREYQSIVLDGTDADGGLRQFDAFGGACRGTLNAEERFDSDQATTYYRYRNQIALNASGSVRLLNGSTVTGGIGGYATIQATGGAITGDLQLNATATVDTTAHLLDEEALALRFLPAGGPELDGQFSRTETASLQVKNGESTWRRTISESNRSAGRVLLDNVAFRDTISGFANVGIANDEPVTTAITSIIGGSSVRRYEQEVAETGTDWVYAQESRSTGRLQLWNVNVSDRIHGFARLEADTATLNLVDAFHRNFACDSTGEELSVRWSNGSADLEDSTVDTLNGYRTVTLTGTTIGTLAGGREQSENGIVTSSFEGSVSLKADNSVRNITGYSTITLTNTNRIWGDTLSVGAGTLRRNAILEASSEVIDAIHTLGKAFKVDASALIYDLGTSAVAKNFTTEAQEQSDNALTSDAQLADGTQGWLSNQQDNAGVLAYQDLADFFRMESVTDLTGWQISGQASSLAVKVFKLTGGNWDNGTAVAETSGRWDLSAVNLEGCTDYRVCVTIDENNRGIFGYELSQAKIA